MGRIIDRAALGALLLTGAYLLFLNAWHSVPLAGALALLAALCAGRWLRGRPVRPGRAGGRAALMALARMDEGEAANALTPLLERRYPGERFVLCPALKHPSAALTANDVLALWKGRRGDERILIASTCPADAEARALAATLDAPRTAILDAGQLRPLLARLAPAEAPSATPFPARLRAIGRGVSAAVARPLSPRMALAAPAMLALYLLLGQPLYLFGGLWVTFRWGASRLNRASGARLFL